MYNIKYSENTGNKKKKTSSQKSIANSLTKSVATMNKTDNDE